MAASNGARRTLGAEVASSYFLLRLRECAAVDLGTETIGVLLGDRPLPVETPSKSRQIGSTEIHRGYVRTDNTVQLMINFSFSTRFYFPESEEYMLVMLPWAARL